MNTFHPLVSYERTAEVLDSPRLNHQLNCNLVLLRSFAGLYKKRKKGDHGWSDHTVGKFWKGHELQLARYSLALAEEHLSRSTDTKGRPEFLVIKDRQARISLWRALMEEMEEMEWPDDPPPLIGDADFHAGMRSYLLYKDIQLCTFRSWKNGEYPDHACHRNLPTRKASWKRDDYIRIWGFFGMPKAPWYGKFNWKDEPDDELMFLSEDRVGQMRKEIIRKVERPVSPKAKKAHNRANRN